MIISLCPMTGTDPLIWYALQLLYLCLILTVNHT